MDKPLISVIVPVYNVEKYLRRCIDSIVGQTYDNLEIILIDDGSTDSSGRICDEFAEKDSRISVIHKPNSGVSDARNLGIKTAKGELLGFVDSDDWVDLRFYKILYNEMIRTGADVVACDLEFLLDESKAVSDTDEIKTEVYGAGEAISGLISDKIFTTTVPTRLYKTALIRDIEFEPGKRYEDILWCYKSFAAAKKIAKVNNKLYYYFQNEDSFMAEKFSRKKFVALDSIADRTKLIKNDFPDLYLLSAGSYVGLCMYYYQTICRLKDVDKDKSLRKELIGRIRAEDIPAIRKLPRKFRHRVWFEMFLICPTFTSFVRNMLKIGL